MKESQSIGWAHILLIVGFAVYEGITMVLQLILYTTSDLLEIGFDILFILLLIFFYDVDAVILFVELAPFIDIIPLFVEYLTMSSVSI